MLYLCTYFGGETSGVHEVDIDENWDIDNLTNDQLYVISKEIMVEVNDRYGIAVVDFRSIGGLKMDEYKQLLFKSDGVKDCVKWLEKRIKQHQKELGKIDWYYNMEGKQEKKAIITELISIKISLEKYAKKLKHEATQLIDTLGENKMSCIQAGGMQLPVEYIKDYKRYGESQPDDDLDTI